MSHSQTSMTGNSMATFDVKCTFDLNEGENICGNSQY